MTTPSPSGDPAPQPPDARADAPIRHRALFAVISRTGPGHDDNGWKHRIVAALERELAAEGHRTVYVSQANADGSVRPLASLLPGALAQDADGVVFVETLAGGDDRERSREYLDGGGRLQVWVSGSARHGSVNSVYYDSEWSGYLAADHLCRTGHRDVAMPFFPVDAWGEVVRRGGRQGWVTERFDGAQRACRRHGARLHPIAITPAHLPQESASPTFDAPGFWHRVAAVFAGRLVAADGITAAVAVNDLMALPVLDSLAETGLRVPGDVSVVGFDNTEAAGARGLTSVEPPIEALGREAARLASRLWAERARSSTEPPPVQHVLVKPTLVVRDSVAAPKAS